jgi:2-keto-4-pentenoate hydratase/2-oxohepta-3-ene-1,7-dioic acid hydratase in catechol pathway
VPISVPVIAGTRVILSPRVKPTWRRRSSLTLYDVPQLTSIRNKEDDFPVIHQAIANCCCSIQGSLNYFTGDCRSMRLATFQTGSRAPMVGVISGDQMFPVPSRYSDMCAFLAGGDAALAEAKALASGESGQNERYRLDQVRLLAPVPRPGKIIAVGLNYRDHAIETKQEVPTSPVIFAKFPSSINGPDADVVIPGSDPQVDYEAELAVVMGRRTKGVSEADALDYVAGYMPLNDVSARRWQFADKQWVRGKSCDTFCPTGPWLTTADAVRDPHALKIQMRVNGKTVQDSNTSNLIFRIPALIAFISEAITLEPGDVIATGTPDGVGVFRKPPVFLKAGDVMEIEIEGLGTLRNRIV